MTKMLIKWLLPAGLLFILSSCATGFVNYSAEEDARRRSVTGKEAEYNVNGLFPDEVLLKTRTQTFNSYYYFQLYNGKIFYKGFNGKDPSDWSILKGRGLPQNYLETGFIEPDRIVEISADANELVALSSDGIFYHLMVTSGLGSTAFVWRQKQGWPQKTTLSLCKELDGMRGWAVGRRGSEVLWYEDINGNQHHFGTIGIENRYFLLEDGQEIRMSDSGLPSDFSHNFLGPERGRFIAESISVSGNTVFLINSSGEMYTRLVDFDTVGSDPMFFKYTYDKSYRDERPGSDYDTNFNYWALPAEDWFSQPEIMLSGNAALTDIITIAQNGRGNSARELRVAGLNPDGESGYYHKQIFDENWKFRIVSLELGGRFITVLEPSERESLRGLSPDRNYFGKLWSHGKPVNSLDLRLERFNLLEGSSLLIVSRGDEKIEIVFHPVEMWYFLKRKSPGRDGTPKLFMATIDVPQDKLARLSQDFRREVNRYFSAYNLKTFAFTMEAVEGFVFAESNGIDDGAMKMVFTEDEGSLEINPELLRRYFMLSSDKHIDEFFSEKLYVKNPSALGMKDRQELLEKIDRNRNYMDAVKSTAIEISGINFSAELSAITFQGVEGILNFTGLYRIDYPKIYTMTMHSGDILRKIKDMAQLLQSSKKWIYDYIITHVEKRIEYYESVLNGHSSIVSAYSETPIGYFEKAGLPLEQLDLNGETEPGIKLETSLMDNIPALIIIDYRTETAYLLEFIDFVETISAYIEEGSKRTGLRLQAGLTRITADQLQKGSEAEFIFSEGVVEIETEDGESALSFKLKD